MLSKYLALALAVACLTLPALSPFPAVAEEKEASLEDAILAEKCTLCHSSKRIITIDPDQLRSVLERMQKKNPDWITDIDRDHIAKVLASYLDSTDILSIRRAWSEAVDRGERLFDDTSLGTNGKACTSCHAPETMKQVADGYPQYDLKLRRIVSFEDRVKLMVTGQLAGKTEGPGEQKILDLIAYLKSLY